MPASDSLEMQFARSLSRAHGVIGGRGTTALWLALRAIGRRDGPGEVILPDLLCMTALEGVLLAGFTPVFADVLPGRYTLVAESLARRVTARTRAILVAHLYGHVADLAAIRRAAPGIPIIEDAVQGIGGWYADPSSGVQRPVGSLGDLSFIAFAPTKMIAGRGGVLLFDDDALLEGIAADLDQLRSAPAGSLAPAVNLAPLDGLLPPAAAATYAAHLRTFAAPALLRPFDDSPAHVDQIRASWATLDARVEVRNAQARWLADHLAGYPVTLPDLRAGDALWCTTLTAPSVILARRIIHDLNRAGLDGSGLYTPLSQIFGQSASGQSASGQPVPGQPVPGQRPSSDQLADRLVNLWINGIPGSDAPRRVLDVIAAVPWERFVAE